MLSRWRARLRRISRHEDRDAELDRELAAWVEELASRYEARGLPPAEARRRALIETEGVEHVKERVRASQGRLSPSRLGRRLRVDVVAAARALRLTPPATAAAVLTIAIAVGINLAMLGLVDRALLSPPPHVTDPGRLFTMALHGADDSASAIRTAASYPAFRAIRDGLAPLARAAAFQRGETSVLIANDQRSAERMIVSDDYFDVLGVRPALGPGIVPARDRPGVPAVVLSHVFWLSAFRGDPGAIGRPLSVGGLDYVVAGVMPAGFSGHTAAAVDLWIPLAAAMRNAANWEHDDYRSLASILVRLEPDTTAAAVVARTRSATGQRASLSRIAGASVGATERRVAWWLTGVSVLVLVIGLANAGTLLVVRAAKRQRDVAIQAALGATPGRLVTQALLEAAAIALLAAGLSVLAAAWLDEYIRRVLFPTVVAQAGPTARTIWPAACAGVLAAIVAATAGLGQLRVQRPGAPAGTARGTGRTRLLGSLLLVQTTLAVLLVCGAAVFGRSLYNLVSQDFGMNMDGVAIVEFEGAGPTPHGVFERAVDSIRALPGIALATPISSLPFGGRHVPPISVPGRDTPPSVGGQWPFLNAATPEFMQILGIRVVDGRSFTPDDDRGALVVIVNETMARGVWPGERAVGKCIRIGFDDDFDPAMADGPPTPSAKVPCREVIGVAKDIRQRSLLPVDNEARLMQYFVPLAQVPRPPFMPPDPMVRGLLLRTTVGADVLAPSIRRLIVAGRTDLPFLRVVPYRQLLEPQLRPWRMATTLLLLFGALALGVAAIGLYAAFAHAAGERRHEMAIRLALGANPAGIQRMVLREGLTIASIGVVAGAIAAAIAGRWAQALLFETAPSDPIVLGSAAALMLLVVIAATLPPARSASRADPLALLKAE